MTVSQAPVIGLVLWTLTAGLVAAQPAVTGTGGDPLTAEKAQNTTALGQTKPPSRAASPASTRPIERRTPRQAADDAISTRICIGCRVDPGTTGSLSAPLAGSSPSSTPSPVSGPVSGSSPASDPPVGAPVKRDVKLDELRTLAEPRKQSDLDTLPLASAHREQARSAQEKTDGLWQSWLVSVCDGCGDQKPARALKLEDWPDRQAVAAAHPADRRPTPGPVRAADNHPRGSLEANLSPENVSGIRRMP